MFQKILIANRGEIACRIIRTCRRLGVATVAVYSEADAGALHVREADEAYCIGPAPARDSYLRGDAIVAVAVAAGAQAIHPGYGFLSENESFAEACAKSQVVFIGPPVGALRSMGSKSAAKALMSKAGVPLVPGYHGDQQDLALLQKEADGIGYPLLIKPSAGGGGKGMRVVERGADFAEALAFCQRAGTASFGDARVLLEKYLERGRHIEVQVFGDTHGQIISLFERDCSAQRRHQKVIEEAPAPNFSEQQRSAIGRAACDAARAVAYVGAGTIEFIADSRGSFYFMEMNTRLQVEHPVTEMITGLDLVEWQLRVAAGEPLPLAQSEVTRRGHAIEARIYAEEPEKGFLPSIGRLKRFRTPAPTSHVRVDAGVEEGDAVTPHYDPMLAKLIVWDHSRPLAIQRMLGALAEFQVSGVGCNIDFLAHLIRHPAFNDGVMDTTLIERELDKILPGKRHASPEALAAAVLWLACEVRDGANRSKTAGGDPYSVWNRSDGWRLNGTLTQQFEFLDEENPVSVSLQYLGRAYRVNDVPASVTAWTGDSIAFECGGRRLSAHVVRSGDVLEVFMQGAHTRLSLQNRVTLSERTQDAHGGLVAPMPGTIISIATTAGADVEKGTALVVMEAMKMEHTLRAPGPGKVLALHCSVGEQVREGTELVEFEPRSGS